MANACHTQSPPAMSEKACKQGRQWVWLPEEASVHRPGASRFIKVGAWYQTKVDEDGQRSFYSEKGKLMGKTPNQVQFKMWPILQTRDT